MNLLDERLRRDLQALEGRALRRRLAVHDETAFPQITFAGRRMLDFAANDYLGLAQHPRVSAALARGAERWGAGAGAAHLLGGHSRAHADFEEALADFLGREAALLFSTGYMANLGLVSTLVGRGDTVIADRLDHASILDAATLSRARLLRYPHGDCAAAATRTRGARGRRLIVTDGVFSMDGDLAPLPALAALAEESDAIFAVDDAHGFGVLGAGGRGSLEHFGLDAQAVPALVVTLGKALGVFGAAVVGSRALIETLVNRARPWIYTTALPPALAEALCVALEVLREEAWRRERVAALVARFRASAAAAGLPLLASSTPIQPILVGDAARALGFSKALADRGYFVPAIRPPTVPAGAARLRISLTAAHSESDLDGLVAALVGMFADA
ncbi:MAG TPA: 8-amino-7-oxononanoate synthase [Gammaproteobacteria bacterium]|nr:8-amino-7-oxononanoate synthase [Gammaproteobacteria bacterium]